MKNIYSFINKVLKSNKKIVQLLDGLIKKNNLIWVFPECYAEKKLKENSLALLVQAIKSRPDIKKYVLYYNVKNRNNAQRNQYRECNNVIYVNIKSLKGLKVLLCASKIFITHGHHDLYWKGVYRDKHKIINLWHGIPLKTIRNTAKKAYKSAFLKEEVKTNSIVICSSKADQENMSKSFLMDHSKVLITGLPRNDFLHCHKNELPIDMLNQEEKLKLQLNNKKLVLFAPTWRKENNKKINFLDYLEFDYNSIRLHDVLKENNLLLGLRLHPNIKNQKYDNDNIINLSSEVYSSTQVILRSTEILVTDYSSIWIDFLQLGKKIIGYFPDHDFYIKNDRELFFELEEIFPGDIFKDFVTLLNYFEFKYQVEKNIKHEKYNSTLELLHQYVDSCNSKRLIDMIS